MDKIKGTLSKLNIKKINNIINISDKILKILYFLVIILAVYVVILIFKEWNIIHYILELLRILSPFFVGFIIAWLLNPLVNKITDGGMKRAPAVILVFTIVVLFIYFFCLLLVPVISSQINDIVGVIPTLITDAKGIISGFFDQLSNTSLTNLDKVEDNFFTKITEIGGSIATNLPNLFIDIVKGTVSALGNIILSLVIGFYMLFNFNKMNDKLSSLLPKKYRKEYKKLISTISVNLYEYVNGMLLVSLIIFVVNSIGFAIIGIEAPLLFGLFCGITNLIPYIGPYIGGAPVVLIAFSQSPLVGIITLVFIIIVQTLEGMFITPLVMSKKMNLSPVTIIIMLLIFGYLYGIIGMIIATPVAALIKIIYLFLKEKYNFFEYESNNKEKSKIKKHIEN